MAGGYGARVLLYRSKSVDGDADIDSLLDVIGAQDPEHLTIRLRLWVLQGGADGTVLPTFTTQLVDELRETRHEARLHDLRRREPRWRRSRRAAPTPRGGSPSGWDRIASGAPPRRTS